MPGTRRGGGQQCTRGRSRGRIASPLSLTGGSSCPCPYFPLMPAFLAAVFRLRLSALAVRRRDLLAASELVVAAAALRAGLRCRVHPCRSSASVVQQAFYGQGDAPAKEG